MGKKGRELRQQKEIAAKYTFSMEQLREREHQAIERFREEVMEDCRKKLLVEAEEAQKRIDEYMEQEWNRRKELLTDATPTSDLMMMLLSLSSRVLIEKFNWEPIPEDGIFDETNRTAKFAQCLVDELNKITEDEFGDIKKYCEETYEMYGIKYISFEENTHEELEIKSESLPKHYIEKYIQIGSLEEAKDDEKVCALYSSPMKNTCGFKHEEHMIKAEVEVKNGKCKLLVWRKVEK